MKCAAVPAFVVLLAAGTHAQQRHGLASTSTSTGLHSHPTRGTPSPSPAPASPFAAGPNTYAPHYDRSSPLRAGGYGIPIYNNPYSATSDAGALPAAPDQTAIAPPKAPEPVPAPLPVAASRGPDLFYVIPGCYAGNRPPTPDRLPAGCDVSRLRTTPIR